VERITQVHHTTILKLLVQAGEKCERIMAEKIRNVEVRDVECDELWAFIGKKQKSQLRCMIGSLSSPSSSRSIVPRVKAMDGTLPLK
jgi:hypothetical protein